MTDAILTHHQRGHWTLQWQCPERNVWRVEHYSNKSKALDFANMMDMRVKTVKGSRYIQIGYWHGN